MSLNNSISHSFSLIYLPYYLTIVFYLNFLANFGVVHSVMFIELPKVYSMENECDISYEKDMVDGRACGDKRTWHIVPGLILSGEFHSLITDIIKECFNWCQENSDCYAIYYQRETRRCTFHKSFYAIQMKMTGDLIDLSLMLKCCSMKERNSQIIYPQLPIVLDPKESCLPQEDTNIHTCKYKVFQEIESIIPIENSFSNFTVKNFFECMQRCLEEPKCKAYRTDHLSYLFITVCHLQESTNKQDHGGRYWPFYVYNTICCQLNKEKLWNESEHLFMLYQPETICKSISENGRENCKIPFWHILEEYRFRGHTGEFADYFSKLYLHRCYKDNECDALSFNLDSGMFYYFKFGKYTEMAYGQKKFTSFVLKCCNGFK